MSDVSISGSLNLGTNNTPTRVGQRVATESEIANVPAPFVGQIIYIEDVDKYVSVKTLKSQKIGKLEIKDKYIDTYAPLTQEMSDLNWIDV